MLHQVTFATTMGFAVLLCATLASSTTFAQYHHGYYDRFHGHGHDLHWLNDHLPYHHAYDHHSHDFERHHNLPHTFFNDHAGSYTPDCHNCPYYNRGQQFPHTTPRRGFDQFFDRGRIAPFGNPHHDHGGLNDLQPHDHEGHNHGPQDQGSRNRNQHNHDGHNHGNHDGHNHDAPNENRDTPIPGDSLPSPPPLPDNLDARPVEPDANRSVRKKLVKRV